AIRLQRLVGAQVLHATITRANNGARDAESQGAVFRILHLVSCVLAATAGQGGWFVVIVRWQRGGCCQGGGLRSCSPWRPCLPERHAHGPWPRGPTGRWRPSWPRSGSRGRLAVR